MRVRMNGGGVVVREILGEARIEKGRSLLSLHSVGEGEENEVVRDQREGHELLVLGPQNGLAASGANSVD
jgi:hypothetical protein